MTDRAPCNVLGIMESFFGSDPSKLCRPAIVLWCPDAGLKFCRRSSDVFGVRLDTRDQAEVFNLFDGEVLEILDQRKIERKVKEIQQSQYELPSLGSIAKSLYLCLRPIVHETASPLLNYAVHDDETRGPQALVRHIPIESVWAARDKNIMVAITLCRLEHEASSVVVLILGSTYEVGRPDPLNPPQYQHRLWPCLVSDPEFVRSVGSEYLQNHELRRLEGQFPVVLKNAIDSSAMLHSMPWGNGSKLGAWFRFLLRTPDRIQITVSLSCNAFLENEILYFEARISEGSLR
ncbi:hypothetical protein F4803DRAFT_455153 [Xylaria telfairii]|nr:hypothetical protein F4803DRAFT_455153 [Xylaria telfairii]